MTLQSPSVNSNANNFQVDNFQLKFTYKIMQQEINNHQLQLHAILLFLIRRNNKIKKVILAARKKSAVGLLSLRK